MLSSEVPTDDKALALMRAAMALLDQAGRSMPADFLDHAIKLLEEERWAAAGIQPAHRVIR